jgi:hypothetical protein
MPAHQAACLAMPPARCMPGGSLAHTHQSGLALPWATPDSGSSSHIQRTSFPPPQQLRPHQQRVLAPQVTLRRPTGRVLCEVLFEKSPARMWNLRPDSLAILLALANAGAHSRVRCPAAPAACLPECSSPARSCAACTASRRALRLHARVLLARPAGALFAAAAALSWRG